MIEYKQIWLRKKEIQMRLSANDLVRYVNSRYEAEDLVAGLLEKFAQPAARERLGEERASSHQSRFEQARRTASNLFTSFVRRRYELL
jgi:hypothetical protein